MLAKAASLLAGEFANFKVLTRSCRGVTTR